MAKMYFFTKGATLINLAQGLAIGSARPCVNIFHMKNYWRSYIVEPFTRGNGQRRKKTDEAAKECQVQHTVVRRKEVI
jgi:hypothetical protein